MTHDTKQMITGLSVGAGLAIAIIAIGAIYHNRFYKKAEAPESFKTVIKQDVNGQQFMVIDDTVTHTRYTFYGQTLVITTSY